jgi:adenylate cyclase
MKLTARQSTFLKSFAFFFNSWFLLGMLLIFIKYYDVSYYYGFYIKIFSFSEMTLIVFLAAALMGFLSAVTEPFLIVFGNLYRKPFFVEFMFRTQRYLIYIVPIFLITAAFIEINIFHKQFESILDYFDEVARNKIYHIALVYIFFANVFINAFRQMTRFLGDTEFWNYLVGKYSKKREEEKIFMFLDLESSTSIAEKLKNIKYSQFIQRFYYDTSFVINSHYGKIYQYVGDEAVITWKLIDGIEDNNCINCFFAMKKIINNRRSYYEKNFGQIPRFKAAIHFGKAVPSEVGTFKNEIAFHGEVLNTTSRILAKCHELKSELLISGEFYNQMKYEYKKNIKKVGEFILRGKNDMTELYSVTEDL